MDMPCALCKKMKKSVKFGLGKRSNILLPRIGGYHPVSSLSILSTERQGTAMYYRFTVWRILLLLIGLNLFYMNVHVGSVKWIKFSISYWSEIQNLKWPHHLVIFASIYSVTYLSWTSLPDTYFKTKISWKKRNLGHSWRSPTVILYIPLFEDVGRSWQSKKAPCWNVCN